MNMLKYLTCLCLVLVLMGCAPDPEVSLCTVREEIANSMATYTGGEGINYLTLTYRDGMVHTESSSAYGTSAPGERPLATCVAHENTQCTQGVVTCSHEPPTPSGDWERMVSSRVSEFSDEFPDAGIAPGDWRYTNAAEASPQAIGWVVVTDTYERWVWARGGSGELGWYVVETTIRRSVHPITAID